MYDNKGDVVFEKQYPEGVYFHEAIISDNGTVAVLVGSPDTYAAVRLHVYDRSGREFFVYPEGESHATISEPMISPNGKYLAVRGSVRVFFNTHTGASWRADKRYIVYEISSNGLARVGWQDDPSKTIDLKEHLGD